MTPRRPTELAGYQFEPHPLAWFILLRRAVGLGAIVMWLLIPVIGADHQPNDPKLLVVFLAGVLSPIAYFALLHGKPRCRCERCRKKMVVLDTPVQRDEISRFGCSPSYFKGQDGWIFLAIPEHTTESGLDPGSLNRLVHRWYVCHDCRRFFLGAKKMVVRLGPRWG